MVILPLLPPFPCSFQNYLLLCHRHWSLCCFPHAAVVASDPRLIVASTPTVVFTVATCCHCHDCRRLNYFTFLYCSMRCWHCHWSSAVIVATAWLLSHCLLAIFSNYIHCFPWHSCNNGGLRKTANWTLLSGKSSWKLLTPLPLLRNAIVATFTMRNSIFVAHTVRNSISVAHTPHCVQFHCHSFVVAASTVRCRDATFSLPARRCYCCRQLISALSLVVIVVD